MGTRKLDHKIGLRDIRTLQPEEEIFDGGPGALPAFSARRRSGRSVSYCILYRPDGATKPTRFTIGTHGAPWTPDMARDKAREVLTDRARGRDPSAEKQARRRDITMADLCDRYLADAEAGRILGRKGLPKKASTLAIDRGRVAVHIKPLIGAQSVGSVKRSDITSLMHAIAEGRTATAPVRTRPRGMSGPTGGRTAATRVVGLLGGIFTYAIESGLRSDNPAHGVRKFPNGRRDRRVSDGEYAALGDWLAKAETAKLWPAAIGCVRFQALTGWRPRRSCGVATAGRRHGPAHGNLGRHQDRPISSPACPCRL